jgi:hypothetical protein
VLGRDLHVRWQAASVQRLLGVEPGSLVEAAITSIVHPDDAGLFEDFLLASLEGRGPATLHARLHHADGRCWNVETVAENRFADPAVEGLVLNNRDISERKAIEDELRHQAFHDNLTGLANRALFEDRLRHALAGNLRGQCSLAVLFLDLDDFKTINDSLGHRAGDELLKLVAARIDELVRPTDTAARLGPEPPLRHRIAAVPEGVLFSTRLIRPITGKTMVGSSSTRPTQTERGVRARDGVRVAAAAGGRGDMDRGPAPD